MAAQHAILPYARWRPYEQLIREFQRTVEQQGAIFPILPPIQSCFTPTQNNRFDFSLTLHVKEWPCENRGNQPRLDVIIKAREELDRTTWSLLKSTVYLHYVIVRNNTADIAQSLHFDFQDPGQDCHPMFHVHLDSHPIPERKLEQIQCDLLFAKPAPRSDCWVTMRIPTSDMTLASVLYCLVAGHLKSAFFREFANKVGPIHECLPRLGYEALRGSLRDSRHFKSAHWFAHMIGAGGSPT